MPTRKAQPIKPAPVGHVLSNRFADPDLVDRMFDYVLQILPELADRMDEAKAAVRAEFGGTDSYVRSEETKARQERSAALAREVLSIFNGRNATEVARRLNISRATVYRMLKQPGQR